MPRGQDCRRSLAVDTRRDADRPGSAAVQQSRHPGLTSSRAPTPVVFIAMSAPRTIRSSRRRRYGPCSRQYRHGRRDPYCTTGTRYRAFPALPLGSRRSSRHAGPASRRAPRSRGSPRARAAAPDRVARVEPDPRTRSPGAALHLCPCPTTSRSSASTARRCRTRLAGPSSSRTTANPLCCTPLPSEDGSVAPHRSLPASRRS
jgi:hypothetical protein